MLRTAFIIAIGIFAAGAVWGADNGGRIYGKITTHDGDVLQGLIRWDKNEASWCDVLDGTKNLPDRPERTSRMKHRTREGTIEIFGIKLGENTVFDWSGSAQSGIRFGHLKSLTVDDDDRAVLLLKSGEEVEFEGGSTDIGQSIREIVVEDDTEGEVELTWDDIDRIDFSQAPGNIESSFGDRLYGTLTTRRGDQYTGWICWDVDEVFTKDILDGEESGRSRKIKFGKITAIERYSSNGANVWLEGGEELLLRETNDVDEGNRGIVISDAAFGQVTVSWDEFERLDFKASPRPLQYGDFDGGKKLRGTVFTENGDSYTGTIRWDDDEEYTWEILDGNSRDVEFKIEFGLVKEIKKRTSRSSLVTVSDGREFRLSDSNDVDEDNKGIFVQLSDGDEVEVTWEDFDSVEFAR